METIKNIAAILGAILSLSAVITLCCKPIKTYIANKLSRYLQDQQQADDNKAIHDALARLEQKLDDIKNDNDITVDFTREQIRGIIKDMFFQYYDSKMLPLYEHKWLLKLEKLYVERLHSNSFIKELIDEMKKWPVDYSKVREGEID